MLIKNNEISLEEAINFSNFDNLLLKRRENGLLLSDYQVSVLNRFGILYKNFNSIRDLLFEIENILDDDFDDELDMIGEQLSEFIYYNDIFFICLFSLFENIALDIYLVFWRILLSYTMFFYFVLLVNQKL